jgi:hypothetical protein
MSVLTEKIDKYLKTGNLTEAAVVTTDSSIKDFQSVVDGIKALKGKFQGVLKNVPEDRDPGKTYDWVGLTSEIKEMLALAESKCAKKK